VSEKETPAPKVPDISEGTNFKCASCGEVKPGKGKVMSDKNGKSTTAKICKSCDDHYSGMNEKETLAPKVPDNKRPSQAKYDSMGKKDKWNAPMPWPKDKGASSKMGSSSSALANHKMAEDEAAPGHEGVLKQHGYQYQSSPGGSSVQTWKHPKKKSTVKIDTTQRSFKHKASDGTSSGGQLYNLGNHLRNE
jgi:hypothetical protein